MARKLVVRGDLRWSFWLRATLVAAACALAVLTVCVPEAVAASGILDQTSLPSDPVSGFAVNEKDILANRYIPPG